MSMWLPSCARSGNCAHTSDNTINSILVHKAIRGSCQGVHSLLLQHMDFELLGLIEKCTLSSGTPSQFDGEVCAVDATIISIPGKYYLVPEGGRLR